MSTAKERREMGSVAAISLSDIPERDGGETPAKKEEIIEYIVVADKTSEVLKGGINYGECVKFANMLRRAGGEVTIFKSTKG